MALLAAVTTACASPPREPPPAPARPPAAAGTPADASAALFTDAQADRGHETFRAVCSECHYSNEFHGGDFQFKWGRRTVADLFREIERNMPDDAPGSLSRREYVDVVSYILQLNGFPSGESELETDEPTMSAFTLAAHSGPHDR